jgi:hypothetical protein
MAHVLLDHHSRRPDAVQLDGGECRYLAAALHNYLALEQEAQRNPSLQFPAPVAELLVILDDLAARHRASEDGPAANAAARAVSAGGRDGAALGPGAEMLDSKQVGELFGITERQARRRCREIGTKVAGRWVVRRGDIEKKVKDA